MIGYFGSYAIAAHPGQHHQFVNACVPIRCFRVEPDFAGGTLGTPQSEHAGALQGLLAHANRSYVRRAAGHTSTAVEVD